MSLLTCSADVQLPDVISLSLIKLAIDDDSDDDNDCDNIYAAGASNS